MQAQNYGSRGRKRNHDVQERQTQTDYGNGGLVNGEQGRHPSGGRGGDNDARRAGESATQAGPSGEAGLTTTGTEEGGGMHVTYPATNSNVYTPPSSPYILNEALIGKDPGFIIEDELYDIGPVQGEGGYNNLNGSDDIEVENINDNETGQLLPLRRRRINNGLGAELDGNDSEDLPNIDSDTGSDGEDAHAQNEEGVRWDFREQTLGNPSFTYNPMPNLFLAYY